MSFVDTIVLVYATARSAPFRDRSRAALSPDDYPVYPLEVEPTEILKERLHGEEPDP